MPAQRKAVSLLVSSVICFIVFFSVSSLTAANVPSSTPAGAAAPPKQTTVVTAPSPTQSQSEIQELKSELAGEKKAQEIIQFWVTTIGVILILATVGAFSIQIWTLWTDVGIRRNTQQETAKHNQKEDQLHERFLKVLDFATAAATETQRKIAALEEGGIKRAGETLQLINNLLTITERAAAKASGAQFEFLSKTINSLDTDCTRLINTATKDEDRDIIAKPQFSEEVRILTHQIDALDNQITTYNESVPSELRGTQGVEQKGSDAEYGTMMRWSRVGLTGPCLFVRGQNHLQHQNFTAAISDWKSALMAKGADSISVIANYWIGYVNNTLGNFVDAPGYLKAASLIAPEQKKPELNRLELETQFFALDLGPVPQDLVAEGERLFAGLPMHRVPSRIISSFATTMGNITFVRYIRDAISSEREFEFPDESSKWFQRAIKVQPRSRWARFGVCQNVILSGKKLDETRQQDVRDVMGSANREYQARVEVRSKVLSRITEYICILMLGDAASPQERSRLPLIGAAVEAHASEVTARTIYSQFRKQNVQKEVFLEEFRFLQQDNDLRATFRMANSKPLEKALDARTPSQ